MYTLCGSCVACIIFNTHMLVAFELPPIRKTIDDPGVYKQKITKLMQQLDTDITQYWTYKDLFNNLNHLGVTPKLVQKGFSNLGDEIRLKRLLLKALRGTRIQLSIVGGSISRGAPFAESGQGARVYFNAIRHWWNLVFGPITSSRMYSKSISIGGVGTDYFSYCLNTHLAENEQPKLILWELSANDRGRYDDKPFPPGQPLEQFTRNVIERDSKPTLMFLNFFRGHDYMGGKCKNYEDEGGQTVASHYRITSISWRNFVCQSINGNNTLFKMGKLFAEDQLHPSILGHAQMAFLVINHLRNSFLRMLRNHALFSPSLSVFQEETFIQGDMELAKILYHETSSRKPKCFTYFTYNDYKPNNTLPLTILRQDDFHYNVFKKFKVRTDQLGGLQTFLAEQILQISITLQKAYAKLIITTHSSTGNAQVWIDKDTPVVLETDNYHMGTKVELITTNLTPGEHTLHILSLKNGFAVCAIAVI